MSIIFNHSGAIGDILYSLYFIQELLQTTNTKRQEAVINIPLDVPSRKTSGKMQVLVTSCTGAFIQPLLEREGFTVTHERKENLPEGYIDLDNFRDARINHLGGDIREWYYQLAYQHLPKNFSRKLFTVEAIHPQLNDKAILIKTPRYINPLVDWKQLQQVKKNLVFMGLPQQHKNFCDQFFPVEYIEVRDGVDAAEKMVSAKGVVGNASGLYTLAQCLKVPRILVSSEWNARKGPGPNVVLPLGGWNQVVRLNDRLLSVVVQLLNVPSFNMEPKYE